MSETPEHGGHLAIPLILTAEGMPAFRFEIERALETLAVASRTAPETLPDRWVVRLAHRFADVLLVRRDETALKRADTWLSTAAKHFGDDPAERVDHGALTARLQLRRGDAVGARRALRSAERALAHSDPGPQQARVQIAHAEVHALRGVYGPVIPLLEPELSRPGAFGRIDDLWRAQRLLAFAHRNRLHFDRAAALYRAVADLCATHEAPRDQSEALTSLGQSLMGIGRGDEAMAALEEAQRLAPGDTTTYKDASAALVAGWMGTGDGERALAEARKVGLELARQGDARGYIETMGLITHLHRIRGEHAVAYRMLLGIFGLVKQRFGDGATRPVAALIEQLEADLGPAEFEALSARILAEMKARG